MVIVLAQSNMFRIPFRPLPSLFGGGLGRSGDNSGMGGVDKRRAEGGAGVV